MSPVEFQMCPLISTSIHSIVACHRDNCALWVSDFPGEPSSGECSIKVLGAAAHQFRAEHHLAFEAAVKAASAKGAEPECNPPAAPKKKK